MHTLKTTALKYCLQFDSLIKRNEECQGAIKEILNKETKCFTNKQSHKNIKEVSTRYCKHNDFNILFCGSDFVSIEVNLSFVRKIDGRN